MKVICVKIPPTFMTIKVEVGEIFVAWRDYLYSGNNTEYTPGYWFVKDRLGNVIPCDVEVGKYFITLEKWREKQINTIL